MARDKPLRPQRGTKFLEKIKIAIFLSQNVKSRHGKPAELVGNSKIVIDRITMGGMLILAKDNDWSPRGLKVPP